MTPTMLIKGRAAMVAAAGAIVILGLGPVDAANNSTACADYKGDNAGYGGDKYTECDADVGTGLPVNFVCASPSGNAVSVTANDPDADAKGKISCDGQLLGKCQFKVTCHAEGVFNEEMGTYQGDCLGGTEEKADTGMAWACKSIGVPAGVGCGEDCEKLKDAVQEAIDDAEEAVDDTVNKTAEQLLAVLSSRAKENTSSHVGKILDDGTGFGIACVAGACQILSVACETSAGYRYCRLVASPDVVGALRLP